MNSIKKHFDDQFKIGRLHNSWLIGTDNPEKTLQDVQEFIKSTLICSNVNLSNHPDYILIAKQEDSKTINLEQVKDLHQFLFKTNILSNYKVGIIHQAEYMNLNAANSCLKILEDINKNVFLFLISLRPSSIITTIRSRCVKFNDFNNYHIHIPQNYEILILSLLKDNDCSVKLEMIKKLSSKDRTLWIDFSEAIMRLLNNIIKNSIGIEVKFSLLEQKIMKQFKSLSPTYLLEKYENIKKIIYDTIDYDLDLKCSFVLAISNFDD